MDWRERGLVYLSPGLFKYPEELDFGILKAVDTLLNFARRFIHRDIELLVTSDFRKKGTGWHPKGRALDGTMTLKGEPLPLSVQWLTSERFRFPGLGLYPANRVLHWDDRTIEDGKMYENRWWRWPICPKCSNRNDKDDNACERCQTSLYRNFIDPLLLDLLAQEEYLLDPVFTIVKSGINW